jgi:hypothetical protein
MERSLAPLIPELLLAAAPATDSDGSAVRGK